MAGPAVHVAGAAIQLPPELIPLVGKIIFLPLNYVAESGRASGRAELRALTLGGAVWDAFRENANCGDLVGTLPGPRTFRRDLIGKIPAKFRQNLDVLKNLANI